MSKEKDINGMKAEKQEELTDYELGKVAAGKGGVIENFCTHIGRPDPGPGCKDYLPLGKFDHGFASCHICRRSKR